MYEELLPLWKARCAAVRDRKGNKRNRYDMRIPAWTDELKKRGLSEKYLMHTGVQGRLDGSFGSACLVSGVMLFTWEAGIA